MPTYSHSPQIEIEIHTRNGQRFTITDCYQYQSNRTLDNPTSRFSCLLRGETFAGVSLISLKGKNIATTLNLYDLGKVWMRDGSGKRWVDCIGFMQRVTPTVAESDGRPEKATQIEFVGLGEALIKYQIFWHNHIAGQNNLGGIGYLARAKGELPKGRPNEVLLGLYNAFFNDDYIFTLADGRKISDVIVQSFEQIPDSLAVIALSALGMEGPIWEALKRYSDAPWCELFLDLGHEKNNPSSGIDSPAYTWFQYGNQSMLYLRPTPFGFSDWRELAAKGSHWGFGYDDSERMGSGEQLGIDADDVYNFFWCPEKSIFSSFDQISTLSRQTGGKLPIYDADSIRRYGLRRLEQGTEYVQAMDTDDAATGSITATDRMRMTTNAASKAEIMIRRTKKLQQWFGYDSFFKGTITTRGRIGADYINGARIGGIIERKRDGMQFYITGISQNWTFPGPHTTSLTVSRGHYPAKYLEWANKHVGAEYVK